MGRIYETIDEGVSNFIAAQKMFFVATAPIAGDGHINLSPKGVSLLKILGPLRVAYLDFRGSGVETIAHLRENQRIVLSFCAFEGKPNILRLHGKGRAIERCDAEWAEVSNNFKIERGVRAIIDVEVTRVSDSCGYGIPIYSYERERETMMKSLEAKDDETLAKRLRETNSESIDGLPGLRDVEGALRSE